MILDAQAADYLASLNELGIRPIEELTPAQVREQTEPMPCYPPALRLS